MVTARSFKKTLLLVIAIHLRFSFDISDVKAEELPLLIAADEVHHTGVEAHCSANESVYQACLGIDKAECVILLKNAYISCDQISGTPAFFDATSQNSISQFSNCAINEISIYVEAKGVDLDTACE